MLAITLVLAAVLLSPGTVKGVPAGTVISNSARADYILDGNPRTSYSNSADVTTVVIGNSALLETFRYAPSSPSVLMTVGITPFYDGTGFVPAPAPVDPGTGLPISLGAPLPLDPAADFTYEEAVFFLLTDPDGNVDSAVADTLVITLLDASSSTIETIILTESGADTGVFTGYMRSGAPAESVGDGLIFDYPGSQFSAVYTDPSDPADTAQAQFLFGADSALWVTAVAGRSTVSRGDFMTYTLTVQNTTGSVAPGTILAMDLPVGFRYEDGSTRIDGVTALDPLIAPDGRSLAFSVGDLSPGQTVTVRFVTRAGAGIGQGKAVAAVAASSGLLGSNTALAAVQVKEDLARTRNTIMGRVLTGSCGETGSSGFPGVRIFLEDGTYVLTDEKGRYHFEGVRSGTHVVQIDLETVPDMYEVVMCDDDTRQSGRPWSRFVDLAGGSLWRVDFNLKERLPVEGQTELVLKTASEPGRVIFNATMSGKQVPLENVRFKVTLPEGVRYKSGTAKLEGRAIGDPEVEGRTIIWLIGDVPAGWEKGLSFETEILDGWDWSRDGEIRHLDQGLDGTSAKLVQGEMVEVTCTAGLLFDSPAQRDLSTPEVKNVLLKVAERQETRKKRFVFRPHFGTFEARLTEEDRQALDIISTLFEPTEIGRVEVTGHTDSVLISERGRRIYADNYELSEARARSMARYLGDVWDLPPEVFIITGKGPDEPLASNETVQGRTLNRRVEVNVVTTTVERQMDLKPVSDQSLSRITVKGHRPGQDPHPGARVEQSPESPSGQADPLQDMKWFDKADGTLDWVAPEEGFSPSVPIVRVAVKHRPGTKVVLKVNGTVTDALTFEGTMTNGRKRATLSLWRGVRLNDGDNLLEAVLYGKKGEELGSIERPVYFAGRPVGISLVPEQSMLTANGLDPPQIAIRLTDESGRPARPGLIGQYSVRQPYRVWEQAGSTGGGSPGGGERRGQFLIGPDGIAKLYLQPTTRSGEVVLDVDLKGGEEEIRAWLTAMREDWILVGLAEGTVGYNTVSGNLQSLEDSGGEEDIYTDGRMAFFAKGRIKGEYLLTLQYDSNGPHGAAGEGLHGTIDPDAYYTLYGDSAEQDYEAPTSKKLYLKIERGQFYALFGDTSTGLTVTELSRYDRRFTGFRSESKGESLSYNLFASEAGQAFVKDEIPGDGTSGLYSLSAGEIIVNSESVRIETRDRFQSHVVLSVKNLTRHVDYNIDYAEGTLFFKSPVPERDAGFNPVFIVVDYETTDPGATGITYGGRAQAVLHGKKITAGVSHIHEDRGDGEGNLVGVDITAKLSRELTLKAESAETDNEAAGGSFTGSAFTVELTHESNVLKGSAYVRRQESGFGIGQQMASESGMSKKGFEGEYKVTGNLSITGEAFRQDNLETGADRQVAELGAAVSSGKARYDASIRQATDTDSGGLKERSEQATAGARWQSGDNRWELRADHEQSIGDNDNTDYPTRTVLGSDYRLSDSVALYAEQEYTRGEKTSASSSRMGMKSTPWKGGKASSSMERVFNENGERVYSTSGLVQTWQIDERWKLSASMEAAKVLKENTSEPLNSSSAPASPDADYTAFSVGAGYDFESWDLDSRLEFRKTDTNEKWGLVSGLYGEPEEGVGISTDLKHFITQSDTGPDRRETDLRLGFVYRPFERRWTFLDRLDYSVEEERGAAADLTAWKLVNNLNANYKASDDLQVSLKYGAKYVRDTIDGDVYNGFTHLIGAQGRYDLTNRWDVGAWTSYLSTLDAGTTDYGVGASLGYGLFENLWLSIGYNIHGFEDTDFSQGDFTAQGPFVKFRFKFDQEDLKGILKR